MHKWLLVGLIGYFLFKTAKPLLSLFQMNQSMKTKQRKTDIRSKVQKMDIQDAEFEEKTE